MKITVEKAHVGQAASLVMVISQRLGDEEKFFTYKEDSQSWFLWDEELDNLEVTLRWSKLSEMMQFQYPLFLETLPLETRAGEFTLYAGYQLGDGIIVFNGLEPLGFQFSE
jgi:hypothetical protein